MTQIKQIYMDKLERRWQGYALRVTLADLEIGTLLMGWGTPGPQTLLPLLFSVLSIA